MPARVTRHYQHARAEGLTQEPEDYEHLGRVLSQAQTRKGRPGVQTSADREEAPHVH